MILQCSVYNVLCGVTHHNEPCDEGSVPDVPQAVIVDVRLHLQEEEEDLVDNVGNPAETSGNVSLVFE